MTDFHQLRSQLRYLDGRSYKAYKDLQGCYEFPTFSLAIDRVQGDPFAAPSQLRVMVPQAVAQIPPSLYQSPSREIALRDYLIRQFEQASQAFSRSRGSGKSGLIGIYRCGQEVLSRSAAWVNSKQVEIRFFLGLPARGRQILGQQAEQMLCADLPQLIHNSLLYSALDPKSLQEQVETVEDADWLRSQLAARGLVAFLSDGAILPRRSGADPRPLIDAIPLKSPDALAVEFDCPNRGLIRGLGIPQGVTAIIGGGYHGKSTLLRAIALGPYNHLPGDGRELVVADPTAVKIRAEDGRSLAGVDISPFINHLPLGQSTQNFSTTNASGSTSQAANLLEAIEAGTKLLLIDEDTAATNFMIRDRRMQQLIAKNKEPITPFIDKVRQLYEERGVSTLLAIGASGDYFAAADTVIAVDTFVPYDVTAQAKAIAQAYPSDRLSEGGEGFGAIARRIPLPASIDPSRGQRSVQLKVRELDEVAFGEEEIELAAVEQLVETGQVRALAESIVYAKQHYIDGKTPLSVILDRVMADLAHDSLDVLSGFPRGDLAQFRRFELAAALNRLRTLRVKQA